MSDFSLDEKIDYVIRAFPELANKRDSVAEFLLNPGSKTVGVNEGEIMEEIRSLLSILVKGNDDYLLVSHGVHRITITNDAVFTEEQIEFLHFLNIDIEQREHSSAIETGNFIVCSVRVPSQMIPTSSIPSLTFFPFHPNSFSVDLENDIPEIITIIRAKTTDVKINAAIDDYLQAMETKRVYQALEDLEAKNNVVAIALLNILDEDQLRLNRRRRFT